MNFSIMASATRRNNLKRRPRMGYRPSGIAVVAPLILVIAEMRARGPPLFRRWRSLTLRNKRRQSSVRYSFASALNRSKGKNLMKS